MQDTGVIQAMSEGPNVSFGAMAKLQGNSPKLLQRPGRRDLSSFVGVDDANQTLNPPVPDQSQAAR